MVLVDEDIDIYNDEEILWTINTRMRGDLDIVIILVPMTNFGIEKIEQL